MTTFLLLVLLFVSFEMVRSCEKICTFLYSNPDWLGHTSIEDTSFENEVNLGRETGLITARFGFFSPDYGAKFDFLRFHASKSGITKQPLVFNISSDDGENVGRLRIVGRDDNGTLQGDTSINIKKTRPSIQISIHSYHYNIYYGHQDLVTRVEYNYKSTKWWNWFQNNKVRLQDTVRIKNSGRCTSYKYISVCSDPTPRLCDQHPAVTQGVDLGSSHTMTCTGSGAPFLDVEWTKDGEPTDVEPNNTLRTTQPDHRIESTLTLSNVTTKHLGTWTCTIWNRNLGNSANKTYTLKHWHPSPVTVLSYPTVDYYQSNGGETSFHWVVQGWPLIQVTLDCGSEGRVTRDERGYATSTPPHITLTLILSDQDVVKCALKDGEEDLDTWQIIRVGYRCEAGDGGVGTDCNLGKLFD